MCEQAPSYLHEAKLRLHGHSNIISNPRAGSSEWRRSASSFGTPLTSTLCTPTLLIRSPAQSARAARYAIVATRSSTSLTTSFWHLRLMRNRRNVRTPKMRKYIEANERSQLILLFCHRPFPRQVPLAGLEHLRAQYMCMHTQVSVDTYPGIETTVHLLSAWHKVSEGCEITTDFGLTAVPFILNLPEGGGIGVRRKPR